MHEADRADARATATAAANGNRNSNRPFWVRHIEALVAHPPRLLLVHPLHPRHPHRPSVLDAYAAAGQLVWRSGIKLINAEITEVCTARARRERRSAPSPFFPRAPRQSVAVRSRGRWRGSRRTAPRHERAVIETCQRPPDSPIVDGPAGQAQRAGPISRTRSVTQSRVLLGIRVALVSLTGLIGVREGQPA